MNEREITAARLNDLAGRAFSRGYTVYSDFLNMEELSILHSLRLPSAFTLFGGFEGAERCVAAFGESTPEAFPIVCVCIKPAAKKFAEKLTHRDYLGALMNLGINRCTLGDIAIQDGTAYLFCLQSIAGYITDNLTRIRHTTVRCEAVTELPEFISEKPPETELTVPSLRIDAVIAAVYRLSRNEASALLKGERVFINSRLITKESALLKEGNTVSVRGHGRFIYENTLKTTKKARLVISIRKYG